MSRRKTLLVQQRLWMFLSHNPIEGYTVYHIRVGSIIKHSPPFYWPKSLYGLWCSLKSINYVACISQPYKILNMGGSSVTSNPMEYQDQANSSFGIHQCLSKQNCSIHFLCFQIHPKRQKNLGDYTEKCSCI